MKTLILILTFVGFALDGLAEDLFLKDLRSNWSAAISSTPKKTGDKRDRSEIEEKMKACRRDSTREIIMAHSQTQKVSTLRFNPSENETDPEAAQKFLENTIALDTVQDLDKMREGMADVIPWSGDYWALRSGGVAIRYLDRKFPTNGTWLAAHDYYTAHPPLKIESALLSPAEKYDSLVNDHNFTLTEGNWSAGQDYQEKFGNVEGWMGLCHGWAPAAFMEPRPNHSVKAKLNENDQDTEFLPDDIKALATLKWANGLNVTNADYLPATRFVGARCNVKNPQIDPESGRIIDHDCFDLNPGTWHIIVTNQINGAHRPFVIDASFDFEVWNQPVYAYNFSYFNPKTLLEVKTLSEARVQLNDEEFKDKFKKFRKNVKATQLVGVVMNVTYTIETSPRAAKTDSEENDRSQTVTYHYDLEIDARGKIVGGEWYQNAHPDFVWMPLKNSTALNQEDLQVQNPADAIGLAPQASRSNVPLRFVLDRLLQAASAH